VAQTAEQGVGGPPLDGEHPRAKQVGVFGAGTRDHPTLRKPDQAQGQARAGPPGAVGGVEHIVAVVGIGRNRHHAQQELFRRHAPDARLLPLNVGQGTLALGR